MRLDKFPFDYSFSAFNIRRILSLNIKIVSLKDYTFNFNS